MDPTLERYIADLQAHAERLELALREQLNLQNNIEVLGEYSGADINRTAQKTMRAKIEEANERARQALLTKED